MTHVMLDKVKLASKNVLHIVLGHPSQEITKNTEEYYSWNITGMFKACSDCQMAKSKQNAETKKSKARSTIPGEIILIDTSSAKTKTFRCSKFGY
jgi:hypothetical protein